MAEQVDQQERRRLTLRAGVLTIGVNVTLTIVRVIVGLVAGSTAVIADAVNSGTDILTTLVVIGGARIASRPPDPGHPYGHGKAEPVAAKLVGLVVILTGLLTGLGAMRVLQGGELEPVGVLAAWVTAGSIGVKEALARHLLRVGRRLRSPAVMADGANQRTDALSSVAALVGVVGARAGLPALDPIMGVAVAVLILRMGLGLYWRSIHDLMDPAPEHAVMERLQGAVLAIDGVMRIDGLRARLFGAFIYVDCEIQVDGGLTVREGHEIARRVKRAVLRAEPAVSGVLVHVNPDRPPDPGG